MSQRANANEQLQDAFEQFNELSDQLQYSYQELQNRVASLTQELYAARSERLKQLTEKEQLAARLSALLEALPGGVIVLDSNSRVCECNPAAEVIFGQPIIGRHWKDITPPGTPACQDTRETSLPDGRTVTISSCLLESGDGCILLLHDVTEMRLLQEQVNRQERLSAMGEVMARLAHQVRTPLATSLLYTSHLSKPHLSPEQRTTFTRRLQEGLYNLDQMINDMLVFTRGGRDGSDKVSMLGIIEQVRKTLDSQLQAMDIEWQVIATGGDVVIKGSQASLAGVLTNLATNALRAGCKQNKLLWKLQSDADSVRISLQDNGPGIPDAINGRIFEPFFTTCSNGTGLGLAIVQAVVEAHGGSVVLDKNVDHGARFVIELPLNAKTEQLTSSLYDNTVGYPHTQLRSVS